MLEASQVLAEGPTKPGASDDIAVTIGHFRERTRIAEHEMHEAVLSCTRARTQMLTAPPVRRPMQHWPRADVRTARRPINARAETVATSPMFRDAFARRRALIPAQAFYEWQCTENAPKQPYAIARRDGETLAFAGVWDGWRTPAGEVLRSFAIVVTATNATMAPIHDRMPVIVAPPDWPLWLGETEGDAASLLHPAAEHTLRIWPVSTRVNRPANNAADLLAPFVPG